MSWWRLAERKEFYMIHLFVEPVSKTKAKVTAIHYRPDLLTDKQKAKTIEVEMVPEAEQLKGKTAQLYINPETKEMWYEYTDRPLTQEELLADIYSILQECSAKLSALIALGS